MTNRKLEKGVSNKINAYLTDEELKYLEFLKETIGIKSTSSFIRIMTNFFLQDEENEKKFIDYSKSYLKLEDIVRVSSDEEVIKKRFGSHVGEAVKVLKNNGLLDSFDEKKKH